MDGRKFVQAVKPLRDTRPGDRLQPVVLKWREGAVVIQKEEREAAAHRGERLQGGVPVGRCSEHSVTYVGCAVGADF